MLRGWTTYRHDVDVEDDKVKSHGQDDGTDQPNVGPGGHDKERLVLAQTATKAKQQGIVKTQHFFSLCLNLTTITRLLRDERNIGLNSIPAKTPESPQ